MRALLIPYITTTRSTTLLNNYPTYVSTHLQHTTLHPKQHDQNWYSDEHKRNISLLLTQPTAVSTQHALKAKNNALHCFHQQQQTTHSMPTFLTLSHSLSASFNLPPFNCKLSSLSHPKIAHSNTRPKMSKDPKNNTQIAAKSNQGRAGFPNSYQSAQGSRDNTNRYNQGRDYNRDFNRDSNRDFNRDSNRDFNRDSNRDFNRDSNRDFNRDFNRDSNQVNRSTDYRNNGWLSPFRPHHPLGTYPSRPNSSRGGGFRKRDQQRSGGVRGGRVSKTNGKPKAGANSGLPSVIIQPMSAAIMAIGNSNLKLLENMTIGEMSFEIDKAAPTFGLTLDKLVSMQADTTLKCVVIVTGTREMANPKIQMESLLRLAKCVLQELDRISKPHGVLGAILPPLVTISEDTLKRSVEFGKALIEMGKEYENVYVYPLDRAVDAKDRCMALDGVHYTGVMTGDFLHYLKQKLVSPQAMNDTDIL